MKRVRDVKTLTLNRICFSDTCIRFPSELIRSSIEFEAFRMALEALKIYLAVKEELFLFYNQLRKFHDERIRYWT